MMLRLRYNIGDAVRVRIGSDADNKPIFASGDIVLVRQSNHPVTRSYVAEVDTSHGSPMIAYLHDIERWNN